MTRAHFYTATTLDGFIADEHDSLEWLLSQEHEEGGPLDYATFIEGIGALAMGATTYEWVRAHLESGGGGEPGGGDPGAWPYSQPTWVFTHRDLPAIEGADVRFVQGDVEPVWQEMVAAADGKDVWVVGGGGLAADFAEAGHLDRLMLSIAPVTLGAGRPLFPRPFDLRLVELARHGAFACAIYDVVGPRGA
ncbi:dihydrofolate reductase family protein [uncultured Nocardioides sp.]|uniref:dihydrofolate reductase family protein n=1 Tax=uncultured Nocardioides sp. TaxID=198441 RepID=UPI000C51E274|nr:deaminase [Nocardioides sp.]